MTDAEDVQEDADRHEHAAQDDERTSPGGVARDRPGDAHVRRRRRRAVGGDQHAHLLGELERGDQEVLLLELVQPQVGSDRTARDDLFAGVAGLRVRGRLGCGFALRALLFDDHGNHGLRDDLTVARQGDLVVGRVGEPRLKVGGAPVGGEDRSLTLRTQRLGAGKAVEHFAVDQEIRGLFGHRDVRGLGLRTLEDRALGDARADHHGGEHESRHSPHETHEYTSPGPAGECGGPSTRHFRLAKET